MAIAKTLLVSSKTQEEAAARSWWIGDWWAFGEHRYGDRKALVESDGWTGPSFGTCMNAAAVCKGVRNLTPA